MGYIGLPVELKEALRIFGRSLPPEEDITCDERRKADENAENELKDHLKQFNLHLHYIDKGQMVIGYEVSIGGVFEIQTIDEILEILNKGKADFKIDMLAAGADLSRVTLSQMECDDVIVEHPEAYYFEWY